MKEAIIKLSKEKHEPEWLLNKRLDALNYFENSKMPSFNYGIGIFINPSSLNINNLTIKDNKLTAIGEGAVILQFQDAKEHENPEQAVKACADKPAKVEACRMKEYIPNHITHAILYYK